MTAINGLADVRGISFGGYPQAERCRLLLGREELMDVVQEDPAEASKVAALQLKGNFLFDPATHPDFLGAILGTGVVRGKVGDILVQGESGAQIMVDSELVEHFEDTLTQVRTVTKRYLFRKLTHLRREFKQCHQLKPACDWTALPVQVFAFPGKKWLTLLRVTMCG
eukprot:CAMPEP_0202355318 /NCGR_PEP_ID=MMETSP1126-20121109/10265_1 /ASSEMBLY_ACC=CAM_ASM_000457 /TAXON_ID=3047 /ORGANISM="Dunaliella tertiolecta, Strain CCMP1320" /LENGTH=166 /DNA_ID=CAMNT_0048947919 /DNA_START=250 /DNA_END=750 /DNA_ORIENTATION=+